MKYIALPDKAVRHLSFYLAMEEYIAKNRGIAVTNIPAYSSESVAQMVFAHLLNIASDVAAHSQCVKSGEWADCKDFTFQKSDS